MLFLQVLQDTKKKGGKKTVFYKFINKIPYICTNQI